MSGSQLKPLTVKEIEKLRAVPPPCIKHRYLGGRQPATLNRQRLARVANLPMEWQEQRSLLGFS